MQTFQIVFKLKGISNDIFSCWDLNRSSIINCLTQKIGILSHCTGDTREYPFSGGELAVYGMKETFVLIKMTC